MGFMVYAYVGFGLIVGVLFGYGACEIRRSEREYWDAYHDGWNDLLAAIQYTDHKVVPCPVCDDAGGYTNDKGYWVSCELCVDDC